MRQVVQKAYFDAMQKATAYSGSLSKGDKVISASSVFSDDLPLLLKIKHGVSNDWEYGPSTIGSVFHIGADIVFKEHSCSKRMSIPIVDGWTLSGEYDLLMEVDGVHCIVDHKLTKSTILKRLDKEGADHDYAKQLRTYKYLLTQTEPEKYNDDNVKGFIAMSFKDGSDFMKVKVPHFTMYETDMSMTDDEMHKALVEKTKRLDMYLETNTLPSDCENKLWARDGSTSKPMKCIKYCSVSDHCPWYKSYNKGQAYSKQKSENNILKSMISRSRDKNKDIRI